MSEHPDITTTRTVYTAIAAGQLDTLAGLLDDEVVFHVPGRGALAGDYQGKEQVLNYLARLSEAGTMRFDPDSFLVGDDHVAVLLDVKGERGSRRLDERGIHLFRLIDGKIKERWSYPPDSYATDEFFS